MLEDEHMAYIPCCVYADNEPPAVEGWFKKWIPENKQQDFTTEMLVCLLIYFYKIEPLELGDKMSLTMLQQSVRYSCSSSWPAFKVLTKTIEATYLPFKTWILKVTPWIFALPSGMAFNAVDRLVCCLQFSWRAVQTLTLSPFLPLSSPGLHLNSCCRWWTSWANVSVL